MDKYSDTVSVGVSLLGVDNANPTIVQSALTALALLLPPEGARSHTPPLRPGAPVRGPTPEVVDDWSIIGSLTAIILLVVVGSELLTVVAPTHQASPAASVAIIDSSITSTVTVSLTLPARLLRSAAPPTVIVPASAPLARGRSQGGPRHYYWSLGRGQVLG